MITVGDIGRLGEEAETAIRSAGDPKALEEVRRIYLGRKGKLPELFRQVPSLTSVERVRVGNQLNQIRSRLEAAIETRAAELSGDHDDDAPRL